MKKALVTGANGFIGSHLVRHLLERGYEVNALVRATGDVRSLDGLPVRLFLGDVRDPQTLVASLQGVTHVFHLAARLMALSRAEFEETNAGGTRNLLEMTARHRGPDFARFLLASSQAAAGPGADATPLDESSPRNPISWYGSSKKAAEDEIATFADRLPTTVVRPSSVYGERETDLSRMFPVVDRRIQPQLGILEKKLVLVHVGDLVKGIVDAAESPATVGKVYFLNHDEVKSARDVIRTIAKSMDREAGLPVPVPLVAIQLAAPPAELASRFTRARPAMTRDKAREVSQRYWVATSRAAGRDFGWAPAHDLLSGMRETTHAWRKAEAEIREMPREEIRWPKYLAVATALGALIEMTSHLGRFYEFHPGWLVFAVVFGGFGFALGTLAMLLRRRSDLLQFLAGSALAFAAEALNVLFWNSWTFQPGWPFGIQDPWLRSGVLGLAGGAFVLIVNAVMRSLYRRRLRLG